MMDTDLCFHCTLFPKLTFLQCTNYLNQLSLYAAFKNALSAHLVFIKIQRILHISGPSHCVCQHILVLAITLSSHLCICHYVSVSFLCLRHCIVLKFLSVSSLCLHMFVHVDTSQILSSRGSNQSQSRERDEEMKRGGKEGWKGF